MSEAIYQRSQQIYDEIKPLVKDIVECYSKSMTILECVDYLVKSKKPVLALDFDMTSIEFLNVVRSIMWEEFSRLEKGTDKHHVEFMNSLIWGGNFAGGPVSEEFRKDLLSILKDKEPWRLTWFPT